MADDRKAREAKMREVLGLEAQSPEAAAGPDLAGQVCETPCAEMGPIKGFFHRLGCKARRWFRSFGRARPQHVECPDEH